MENPANEPFNPSTHLREGPGTIIGRYKLLEQVGEGGFGVVYVAEQREPVKRRVALKIIRLGMDSRQVVARFEAERQALALMEHPNIAKVLDGGATDTGRPYFVMELVRGIKITDYCDQHQLPTSERLRLFMQVCQAIQHAHQKGIIHRDIKPSNILVTLHDGVPVPKVIDFGIAKATQQELSEKTVYTKFQQFVGTPAYMSPEQAEMSGLDIDTRSDIYSLGVLLYELLSGKTPFDAVELVERGLDEMRRTIREEEPTRPSTRVSGLQGDDRTTTAKRRGLDPPKLINLLRGDLDWVVMKCLEKDRARRYETATGLARDLQRYLTDEPVMARPPSAAYRFRKLVRRNKVAFAAGAALSGLLVLGTVLTTWQAVRATRAERRAEEAAQRANAEARNAQESAKAATQKSTVAEAQRQRAEHYAEAVRLLSYVDAMNVSQRYCQETNFAQASSLLQSRQLREGNEDARGFEWRYLYRLCRGNYSTTLPRHEQVLGSMEFTANGHMLATYCWDRKLRLWDLEGTSKAPLFEIGNATGLGGFSADGDRLIFGTLGGSIQEYQIGTGKVTKRLESAGEIIAFSATANLVITISSDFRMRVWDLASGQLRFSLPSVQRRYLDSGWTDPAVLAPNGAMLAIIEPGEGSSALHSDLGIRLWDLRNGADLGLLKQTGGIRSLKFSPTSADLAVGDAQGGVKVWNLVTRESRTIDAHGLPVLSLAFSPGGDTLATGSSDETIKLWDLATRQQKPTVLRGQVGAVSALAFAPDGKHLASGSRNSPVRIWSIQGSETLDEIRGLHAQDYGNFAFSPDGASMAGGCQDDTVVIWDVATLRTNAVLQGLGYVVAFTSDSRHLLASGAQDLGYWCDLETGARRRLPAHSGNLRKVICVDLSPDRRLAALGYDNGTIELWELDTGKPLGQPLQAHTGRVRTLSFSSDGNTLVSGGSDRAVRVWDTKRQINLGEKVEHKGAVCAAVISHDGTKLASGCGAGTLKLWDPANLTNALITVPCHKSTIRTLDFSRDGRTLASGSEDRTVKLWNMASLTLTAPQREVASFQMTDKVRLIEFSPDDNTLAIITDDGVLRLLRAVSLKEADEETAALRP